jgi:hypothetical protein
LDQITDDSIVRLIKQLVDHYRTNISNRFIRPALLQLPFDEILWSHIESLTERFDQLSYQGFNIEDLYRQLSALVKFVYAVRREIAPTLRYRLGNSYYTDKTDKVLRDMAIHNFSSNLQVFAGLLLELYNKLVDLDTADAKGKRPIYTHYPDLEDIEDKLTGNLEAENNE